MTNAIKGFIVQSGYNDREEIAVALYCNTHRLQFRKVQFSKKKAPEIPDGYIPCGSIPWITQIVGRDIVPNYYPDFLSPYLNRRVWKEDKWPLGIRVFIKPADKHKRFTGFVTYGTYKKKKKGPYWCSEIISFENEWRYYIAHGKVVTAEWYSGDQVNTPPAPSIEHIKFPDDYFAAVDFGTVKGELTLVEAHEPFSCGWYGKDHEKYVQWLTDGWLNREKWLTTNDVGN